MKNGMIKTDSKLAKHIGFTSDKFEGYLWKTDNDILISFIVSKNPGRGNLSKLFDRIIELKYNIKVPTPLPHMEIIITKKGFKRTYEYDDFMKCDVEVWVSSRN